MQIDYALILSAGLGTRMGEIGKKLPKVLWPVYLKSMIELQINYCEELGIKKIFINTHFLHSEIEAFLTNSGLIKKVNLLHEDPLLDSGGAIHNLARRDDVQYKGNLLLVNGDQFLFFDKKFWNDAVVKVAHSRAVLFGIKVHKESSYNETILENEYLKAIRKNTDKEEDYITYSGLGILNLNDLTPVDGISKFFDSVANFKREDVLFINPAAFEYWDFGTAEIYAKNIFKIMDKNQSQTMMVSFLKKFQAYSGNENLFADPIRNSIDLENLGRFEENTLSGKGLVQKI